MARTLVGGVIFLLALTSVLAACSSGSPATSPASDGASASASAQASVAAASQAAAPSGGSSLAVDLTFSGPFAFTARGTSGQCNVGRRPDGTPLFSFQATNADYAGLEDGLYIDETMGASGAQVLDVKLLVAAGPWFESVGSGWTFDAATLTATLDFDLVETPAKGAEHVAGTVNCPR